ncbi:ATP-dependent DNA helicase pif1-like [Cotesia typhae]|uniref:ATP-dependent DNA helicase pif1-like n=1 Tax=Cotesia typhae TaxID=2053667 RepID=UPI003D686F19
MKHDDILELLLKANEQQLQITMHCLHSQKIGNPIRLMISGQAGTGKSFLIILIYQVISDYYTKKISCTDIESAHVILAAPSGKAAFVIHGVTVHSCFCLPRDNMNRNISALSSSVVTSLRFEMRNVKVVIIDEVSMIG